SSRSRALAPRRTVKTRVASRRNRTMARSTPGMARPPLGSPPARARAWRDPVHPSPDAPRTDSLPHRASTEPLTFVHRTGVWDLADRPRVVGILNLTPDSFYDGG